MTDNSPAMTCIEVAGWRIGLVCAPETLAREVAGRFAPFVRDCAGPLAFEIAITERADLVPDPSSHSVQTAALTPEAGSYRLAAGGIVGHVALEQGRAALQLGVGSSLSQVEFFLRMVCALNAFRDGGLLLHAAGLLTDGRVHLFTGISGSGKSTVTALSTHAIALSDDLVLLRPSATGWIAYGTPFWNAETTSRVGQTAFGPAAGIYKLVKDRDVYMESLSPATAAAELAANCPVVNGQAELWPDLLTRCQALAGALPVLRLHFRKDPSFWRIVVGGSEVT